MSKEQALETINSHNDSIHRDIGGILTKHITTDVEWIDLENKIYNEIYYKKVWFFGVSIYDRRYIAYHNIADTKETKIGFSAGKKVS